MIIITCKCCHVIIGKAKLLLWCSNTQWIIFDIYNVYDHRLFSYLLGIYYRTVWWCVLVEIINHIFTHIIFGGFICFYVIYVTIYIHSYWWWGCNFVNQTIQDISLHAKVIQGWMKRIFYRLCKIQFSWHYLDAQHL